MSEPKRICVAVVDDDQSFARAIKRLLRAAGIEAAIYSSAEAFLVATPQPPPDCLVLDIQLGEMSGFDLQLRLAQSGSTTPIIFITAHDEPEVREMAVRAGCMAYLRKPFSADSLLSAIRKAVADVPEPET